MKCGRLFYRLDTHLRLSAQCRVISSMSIHQPSQDNTPLSESQGQSPILVSTTLPTELGSPQVSSLPPNSDEHISIQPKTPFNCPRSSEEWLVADEQLSIAVVPQVLAAATIDNKNQALCDGVYDYFSVSYGTQSRGKPRKKRKSPKGVKQEKARLREERNKARQQLRKAKRHSSDPTLIQELARRFHQYLRQYSKAARAKNRKKLIGEEGKARKKCAQNF